MAAIRSDVTPMIGAAQTTLVSVERMPRLPQRRPFPIQARLTNNHQAGLDTHSYTTAPSLLYKRAREPAISMPSHSTCVTPTVHRALTK